MILGLMFVWRVVVDEAGYELSGDAEAVSGLKGTKWILDSAIPSFVSQLYPLEQISRESLYRGKRLTERGILGPKWRLLVLPRSLPALGIPCQ